jgi:hypothetical protein
MAGLLRWVEKHPIASLVGAAAAIGGVVLIARSASASTTTPSKQPPTPPPTGGKLIIAPGVSGNIPAKVGDTIVVQTIPPWSNGSTPGDPNGFAIYAAPTILAPLDPSTYVIINPGTVHIAWGSGTWGPAGEVYIQAV